MPSHQPFTFLKAAGLQEFYSIKHKHDQTHTRHTHKKHTRPFKMLKGLRTFIFSLVHKEKKSQDMLCWFRNAETAKSRGSIFGELNKIAEEKKKEKEEEKSRKKKKSRAGEAA